MIHGLLAGNNHSWARVPREAQKSPPRDPAPPYAAQGYDDKDEGEHYGADDSYCSVQPITVVDYEDAILARAVVAPVMPECIITAVVPRTANLAAVALVGV